MGSIRWRIGGSVFLLVAVLQIGISIYVLERLDRVQREQVDQLLLEELSEVEAMLGLPELEAFLEEEVSRNTKWNETFFEIRDAASGRTLIASKNVPPGGLGTPVNMKLVESRGAAPMTVWERPHPASGSGHVHMRVGEAERKGFHIRVGRSLKLYQKTYWRLREQLAWSMVGVVSVLGAAGAWWVTRRSLRPIDAMVCEARKLGRTLEGEIPRTGTGDELDRLAEVLNEMLRRVRGEVQRVRRLGADAAHALRTPLTAMRGHLELNLQNHHDDGGLALAIEALDEAVLLVNQLLRLEQIESGPATDVDDIQIDSLVQDVVDAVRPAVSEQKVVLKFVAEPARVRGHRPDLRSALLNLLDNALRHTPPGGRIDVSVERVAERWAVLSVEDSGPGLRPDQLERVFERFYSEREGAPGAGLGIPITAAVAEAHGGRLTAHSPRGARFEIWLPLADGARLGAEFRGIPGGSSVTPSMGR